MIKSVCSHIPSTQPDVTRDFLVELLGMKEVIQSEQYIELHGGNGVIGILACDQEPNEQSIAVEVDGIDELWEAKKDYLTQFHLRDLFTQPYGAKEFHVVAPKNQYIDFCERTTELDEMVCR